MTDYNAQFYFIPWDKYLYINEIMSDPRSLVYPKALIHAKHQILIDCSPNQFAEGRGREGRGLKATCAILFVRYIIHAFSSSLWPKKLSYGIIAQPGEVGF